MSDPWYSERDEARFWGKVALPSSESGCMEWNGSLQSGGYGQIWMRSKVVYAHRVAHELRVGPIPEGLQIDHLCRNRRCVRPEHLEAVTQEENIVRGESYTARAARKTHCLRGHEFTEENTYICKRGRRLCRPCARIRDQGRKRKKAS